MNRAESNYNVGNLESKVEVSTAGAETSLDKIILLLGEMTSSLQRVNSQLDVLKDNSGLKSIEQDLSNIKNETTAIDPLLKNLRELQTEFSKSGNNQLANQVKEFTQELYKTEYSKSDEKIEEIRNLIEQKLGHNFVEEFNKSLDETAQKKTLTEKALNFGDAVKATIKFGVIFSALKKGFNTIANITKANIDMIETQNLFEISMGKVVDEYGNLDEAQSQYYTKAMAFQDKMNEKFGTNKKELMEFQAKFNSLYANQGVDNKTSEWLSEQLIKAGYDIASLRNQDVDSVMNKLYSGITGQTKSIRDLGVDIGEGSVTATLQRLGINRTANQLSYAEAEIARYITIMEQASNAQGDFARSFERPAQQIKVFKDQLAELGQVAGSFFSGLFGKIMPYVNGIIMAIKEILKALGAVFGFEIDTGNTSLGAVSDTVGDIGTGLGNATKKAKEFKKQLMGFDEINNITPPTQSTGSGGSGGGAVGGIDGALLNALKEWDNKMDSISGKAQEIRDKMLEWLGFVRNDDGTWRLGEGLTNFEKILDVVKAIGFAIGTWKLASTFTNLLKNLGILGTGDIARQRAFQIAFGITLTVTGFYLLYKGIKHILEGNVDLFTILETIAGGAMGGLGIVSLLKGIVPSLPVGKAIRIVFGIELLIGSAFLEYQGIKKVLSGDLSTKTLLELVGGSAGLGVSTFLLTKNIKLSLVVTSFALAFDVGAAIGQEINNNFGDSYDWYLKNFNVHLEDGIDFSDVLGIIGTMLGTIGDVITHELHKVFKFIPDRLEEHSKDVEKATKNITEDVEEMGKSFNKLESPLEVIKKGSSYFEKLSEKAFGVSDDLKDVAKSYVEATKSIQDNYDSTMEEIEIADRLSQGLDGIVDSNGRVIAGNEERVKMILGELNEALGTEYELDGNIIKKNGEAVGSYGKLRDEISNVIEAKKEQAEQEAILDLYKESIKTQIQLEKDLSQAIQDGASDIEQKREALNEANKDVEYYGENLAEVYKQNEETVKESTSNIAMTLDELSANMLVSGQVTQEQFSTMITEGGQKLQEMIKNDVQKWNELYSSADTAQQASMLSQSTTLDTWSPTLQQKWANMAKNSASDFKKGIDSVDNDVKVKILSSITNTENLTPEMVNAWSKMATDSNTDFNNALASIPDDVQGKLLASIAKVNGLDETSKEAYRNLSANAKKAFNDEMYSLDEDAKAKVLAEIIAVDGLTENNRKTYENLSNAGKQAFNDAMNSLDADARDKVQSAINEINGKVQAGSDAGASLGWNTQHNFNINLGTAAPSAKNFIQGFIDIISLANPLNILGKIGSFAAKIVAKFNQGLDEHSPSRETMKSAKYFIEGFTNQLNSMQNGTFRQVQSLAENIAKEFDDSLKITELRQGIRINPKDFEVNTNQYVNYSAIKGQILAQSQVSMNENIADKIAEAVAQSMKNTKVDVNLNAKVQKGIMLETVQQEAREYTMQTGEPAFDY